MSRAERTAAWVILFIISVMAIGVDIERLYTLAVDSRSKSRSRTQRRRLQ